MEKLIFFEKKYFFFLSLIFTLIVIFYSPAFFPEFLPDSYDYIKLESSNHRNLFYPLIFNLFNFINIDIITFQICFLALSISFLISTLISYKFNKILIFFFWLILAGNTYYTSFAKTILPETLIFSLINLIVGIILLLKKKFNYPLLFVFSICVGLLAITKKVGIIFTLLFITYSFFTNRSLLKRGMVLIISLIIILLENITFLKFHDKRGSVLPNIVMGKLFYITGSDSFYLDNYRVINKFPNEFELIKKKSMEINNFVNSFENIFARSEIQSDYEVVLQYQNIFELGNYNEISETIQSNYKIIFLDILKYNFFEYMTISFGHYVGMWVGGAKKSSEFQNRLISNKVPFDNFLEKSSSNMNLPKKVLLQMSSIYFKTLFIVFVLTSIFYLLEILISRKFNLTNYFLLLCNCYLFLVSFINVSTVRYLMPIYPVVILVIFLIVNKIILKKCVE